MKGYIVNLRAYDITIRSLGWSFEYDPNMPDWAMEYRADIAGIADDMEFEDLARAMPELEEKITSGDIEVQNSSRVAMSIAALRSWIRTEWVNDRYLPPHQYRIDANSNSKVPDTGMMALGSSVAHTSAGFMIPQDSILRSMSIAINKTELTNTYDLRIYSNPTAGTPILVVNGKLFISPGAGKTFVATDLSEVLLAGEYGLFFWQTAGLAQQSRFKRANATLIIEGA